MNARQKAKHFKALYELSKQPYRNNFICETKRHCRVTTMVDPIEHRFHPFSPTVVKELVEDNILRELRPYIWDNVKIEYNPYTILTTYSLEFWV